MTSKLPTTTREKKTDEESLLPLITPGEFLAEEFLDPLGLSANALALPLRVVRNRYDRPPGRGYAFARLEPLEQRSWLPARCTLVRH